VHVRVRVRVRVCFNQIRQYACRSGTPIVKSSKFTSALLVSVSVKSQIGSL